MTVRRFGVGVMTVLALGATGALWASLAGAAESVTITKCTTKHIEEAVEKGGSYVLQCEGDESIQAPKPAKTLTGGLSPGFTVQKGVSVSFSAPVGDEPTFENAEARSSRIFTVAAGGSLSLTRVILSATVDGPAGIAAGKAKTDGKKGEKGEEEEETEEGLEELAKEGDEGVSRSEVAPESSAAGGDGTAGASGGFVAGKALNAPAVQGGAISNAGTLTLDEDEFPGDGLDGGMGGNGGGGGGGGAGGSGGAGGIGAEGPKCDLGGGIEQGYRTLSGAGGDGARGGDGGPGTPAGNGGEALGGAIYNSGTLTVQSTGFHFDTAIGGVGGNGGSGGKGGNGGNGGFGYPGGDGSGGGNGANGGAAGNGASGLGGSIYNVGKLTVAGSQFEEDTAAGGQSGDGGDAGSAGKGGSGGLAFSTDKCENKMVKTVRGAGGSGADGGLGAEGGNGANGGDAEGGAIYSTAAFTLTGTSFYHDSLEAGLGASGNCEAYLVPCPGKGSNGGEGGEEGFGEPNGSKGNTGARNGPAGMSGATGAALGQLVFGQAEGETPEETKPKEEEDQSTNPPGSGPGSTGTTTSSSSTSTTTKSSGGSGGKGSSDDNDDDNEDDAKVSDTGHTSTKQSGASVTVETGESVSCPAGGSSCEAEVSATISEEMPAGSAAKKQHHKPKALLIGHATLTVAAGHTAKVALHLNPSGVAPLRKHHHLSVTIDVTVESAGTVPVKHTRTIAIVQPKPVRRGRK
jgi:hypothetical protein